MKDNIHWIRAQHGGKLTINGEFNSKVCKDLVAAHGGKLVTDCPDSPETMSIGGLLGGLATVMLLHCGMAEHFREEETLNAVDLYNRVTPAKPYRTGLRQSPFEKMHGDIPSLDDFRLFGCRGYALIPVPGNAHKRRSEQVMYMWKESGEIRELASITPL